MEPEAPPALPELANAQTEGSEDTSALPEGSVSQTEDRAEEPQESPAGSSRTETENDQELTEEEEEQVRELEGRDQEVRRHEQAHMAAGGQYTQGGPTYDYQTGPDGQRYAVGGKVKVDTSSGRTPEETIAKAQTIRRAALAPADPSAADRAIAANASRMEAQARQELQQERSQELQPQTSDSSVSSTENATVGPVPATEVTATEQLSRDSSTDETDTTQETSTTGIPTPSPRWKSRRISILILILPTRFPRRLYRQNTNSRKRSDPYSTSSCSAEVARQSIDPQEPNVASSLRSGLARLPLPTPASPPESPRRPRRRADEPGHQALPGQA